MMAWREPFFVCGFGDPAAGVAGLVWNLGEPGSAVQIGDEVSWSANFALEEGGDAATLEISGGDTTVEAVLSPRTAQLPLGGEGGLTVVVCVAEVTPSEGSESFRCVAQISRWGTDPLEGAGSFRHLAVDAGDESLVIVESRGDPGVEHGDEATRAWSIRDEEDSPFEDAFVSTQYDGNGHPTRFGLELWPEEVERASRAAATRIAASPAGGIGTKNPWAGFYRCQTNGVLGHGSYLLWRA
jgi:hypothetical protein